MTKTASFPRLLATTVIAGAVGAVFGLSGGTALAAAAPAAATTQSFQISPPTSNYAANPGTTVTGTVKVTNLTAAPISLQIGKDNFVAKGEEGEVELVDNADPLYSLAPWFNLATNEIDLPARATQSVNYSIAVPQGAEPGGRYSSIVFSTIPPRLPGGQSGATVQQSLGGLVFLRINGQAKENLTVASFKADKSFYEYGPISLTTRIKNIGDVHEKPTGAVKIYNMFGIKVATLPLDQHFVIPTAIRRLHNTWAPKGLAGFLVGQYTADMTATYAGKTLTATTTFTVVPWRLLGGILLVLILLFVVFWRGRKRLSRAVRILAGRE